MKKNKKTLIAAIPLFLIVILYLQDLVSGKVQRYFDAEPGGTDAPDNQNPE